MLFVHILLDSHSPSFPPCILPFVYDYSCVSSSRVSSHDLPCSFVFSVLFLGSFPLSLLQIPLFSPLSSPTKGARTEHPDPQRLLQVDLPSSITKLHPHDAERLTFALCAIRCALCQPKHSITYLPTRTLRAANTANALTVTPAEGLPVWRGTSNTERADVCPHQYYLKRDGGGDENE